MDIKELLRKLANGYHFGYPECCISQFLEDEIFRGGGQPNDTRKYNALAYRKEMGIDYIPCDDCIHDWVGQESLNTLISQILKINKLTKTRNLKPLDLNLSASELLKNRWKMVDTLAALSLIIMRLSTAPDEDADDIYAESTRLAKRPGVMTDEERLAKLELKDGMIIDVWPLEVSLGRKPDNKTQYKLPNQESVDEQPNAFGSAHPPVPEPVE